NTVKNYTYVATSTTTTESLGRKYMGLYTYSGVMTGAGHVENKGYTMTVGGMNFTEMDNDAIAFMGQKVKVLYKDTNDVYGLYTHGDTTVSLSGVIDDLDKTELNDLDNVLKFDGKEYKSDLADAKNVPVITANGSTIGSATTLATLFSSSSIAKGSALKLYDTNGNGKIDIAVVAPVEVYKVNYISSTEVTLVGVEASNATINGHAGSYKLEDTKTYEGMAKGDYVAFLASGLNSSEGKNELTKLSMTSGTITGTKGSPVSDVLVDGTWYTLETSGFSAKVNNSISFVAVGGHIYAAKTTAASVTGQYLLIKGLETSYNDINASVLLSDGTTKIITLEKGSKNGTDFYKAKVVSSTYFFDVDGDGAYDTDSAPATGDGLIEANTVWAYTVNSDGTYRLTQINATTATDDILGVKGTGTATLSNKMFGTANIDDSAKVFVKDTDGYKVVDGKTVKSWGNTVANQSNNLFTYTTSNGYRYANMAFINFGSATAPSAEDGSLYGYIVGTPYASQQDNKDGKIFTIWDGSSNADVFASNGDISGSPVKGDIVKFVELSSGKIKIQATYSINTAVAVDGYDASTGKITFKTAGGAISGDAVYEVVNDTKFLAINSADNKGVSGADASMISIANKDSAGNLMGDVNALYVVSTVDSNGNLIKDLSLVVVDTANKISGMTKYAMATVNETHGDSNGLTVTVTPSVSNAINGAVVTYTVTVKGTAAAADASDEITINGIGDLTVSTAGNTTVTDNVIKLDASATAIDATYTATVTVNAAAVTPTISYAAK
ncbi:MAG: hypothetical protein VB096_06715, partial [Pseudoflavonifractor sp.]|nr:hypothetical protein [Pseudoflavonifractor sp.]